jgi:uncharacterized protein (UPF0276 family)
MAAMHGAALDRADSLETVPARAGVGLKACHVATILRDRPEIGWFEVHPENYMGAGGPPHRHLAAIRECYPLSLHGVGLSIGGAGELDRDHLRRLGDLVRRYRPGLFSEHLAWSSHDEGYFNDLLPLPYTKETLQRVAEHVEQVQEALGRRILIENPSTYVRFAVSDMSEIAFLTELVHRTGCGLLLDVNNVHVQATNHGFDAAAYIDAFPVAHVGEIHLAGHAHETDDLGEALLIDTHDRPVDSIVWDLFARAVARTGPVPTLIEWDADVPDWPVLHAEAKRAEAIMRASSSVTAGAIHGVAG